MAKRPVVIGERNGTRVVVRADPATKGTKHPKYVIRCDCDDERVLTTSSFRKSPTCQECASYGAPKKYGDKGIAKDPLYRTWVGMRRRCRDQGDPRQARYGARGIKVCEEWHDFERFRAWSMENGYEPGLSIERRDSDLDYSPSNCEWLTRSENSKRCRAEYHFVKKTKSRLGFSGYNEPWCGDA